MWSLAQGGSSLLSTVSPSLQAVTPSSTVSVNECIQSSSSVTTAPDASHTSSQVTSGLTFSSHAAVTKSTVLPAPTTMTPTLGYGLEASPGNWKPHDPLHNGFLLPYQCTCNLSRVTMCWFSLLQNKALSHCMACNNVPYQFHLMDSLNHIVCLALIHARSLTS